MRRYRIGRADTNDIVLADTTVSREHAELVEIGGGRFEIKDLGSTFGISVREGQAWTKVTACELGQDAQVLIGEYATTVAELLRDTDKTVVRGRTAEPTAPPSPRAPDRTAPPRPPSPGAPREATAPPSHEPTPAVTPPPADSEKTEPPVRPAPAPPRPAASAPAPASPAPPRPAPPRPAPPRPAAPRPAAPRPAQSGEGTAMPTSPPRPATPSAPPFQFLRNMPPEKRTLLWIGVGFAGFLFVSLITLILVLVL